MASRSLARTWRSLACPPPVRIAAIADFHARIDRPFPFPGLLGSVRDQADLLLIAGDLTDNGRIEEFALVGRALQEVGVPVVVVPGNHDRRCLRRVAMRDTLADAGGDLPRWRLHTRHRAADGRVRPLRSCRDRRDRRIWWRVLAG